MTPLCKHSSCCVVTLGIVTCREKSAVIDNVFHNRIFKSGSSRSRHIGALSRGNVRDCDVGQWIVVQLALRFGSIKA